MSSHGFILLEEHTISELSSVARLWLHEKSGARLLSFINNDENKVFGVSFRTPPADSTGVAHILEHSVLCGSEKFPVKEPFVELLKGSLQTFLNAFTYPDKTCYPVASANVKDFRNLTDVYLDAVFFPVISEKIFQQEGWHVEAESPEGPFSYKGVVYNEMKGAFSSPESVLGRYCLHSLFPDTVYGLESGGDPAFIPDLTYQAFKDFHKTYYHPSNGRFFFWGDDPEEERLEQLGAVLDRFSLLDVSTSSIALQPKIGTPRSLTVPFVSGGEEKGMVVVNWLGPDVMDVESTLAFKMLDHILLGMPASPLRRALIESGLGEDLAGQGLEAELRQLTFDAGLKGVEPKNISAVEQLIADTLTTVVREGISSDAIEAAVNSVEFALRENNTGRFPVGLAVMLSSLTTWLHDGDPLAPLCFEKPLASIKAKIASGEKYFEELVDTWLIKNSHRVTVSLLPDTELEGKQKEEEQKRLDRFVAQFGESEKVSLVEETKDLLAWQGTPDSLDALATIPRLGKEDLPLENTSIPFSAYAQNEIPGFFHGLPTGGIIYVETSFDLSCVQEDSIPLLPLFGRALMEMGTAKRDFVALNMAIASKTGGMDADSLFVSPLDSKQPEARFVVEGKVTLDKLQDLFGLLQEIITSCHFDDQEHFLQMVLEEKARAEHSLVPSGHMVAATRLRSMFSIAGSLSEMTSGVSQLFYLRTLAERVQNNWSGVLEELLALKKTIFTQKGALYNITALPEQKNDIVSFARDLLQSLPLGHDLPSATWHQKAEQQAEGLLLPAQVNYVGKGINLFDTGYRWHGSAMVILKYLRTGYLWEKVRVQGGAYGCVCGLERSNGSFYMVSYRDPAVMPTLNVYDHTAQSLQKSSIGKSELEAAIVGAVGELDSYLLPDAKGHTWYLRHLMHDTEALRQQLREEVLGTTEQHFKEFGAALEAFTSKGRIVSLGGSAVKEAATEHGWEITTIL